MYIKILTLLLMLGLALFIPCLKREKQKAKSLNLIFLISDDQAYLDYSFTEHDLIKSQNLDRLVQASAPLSSLSFASIISALCAVQNRII